MADTSERHVSVPGRERPNYDDSSFLRVNYLTKFLSFFVATGPSVLSCEGNKGQGPELEHVQSRKSS
jgi:hypothetical protein